MSEKTVKKPRPRNGLLNALLEIQKKHHWLPEDELKSVAGKFGISYREVLGVASFYAAFRLQPAGKHTVKVCTGTACHIKGAEEIYQSFAATLGIEEGKDTDKDGLFTLSKAACLGCCMLAPAVQIDETIYGPVSKDGTAALLKDFLLTARGNRTQYLPEPAGHQGEIRICTCSSCSAAGSEKLHSRIRQYIKQKKAPLTVKTVGCSGLAYQAPLMQIALPGLPVLSWGRVTAENVDRILDDFLDSDCKKPKLLKAGRKLLNRLLQGPEEETALVRYRLDLAEGDDAGFTSCQCRIATNGSEENDPLKLEDYRKSGGTELFSLLESGICRKELINRLQSSGLRGRGGAGFRTSRKWLEAYLAPGQEKTVICNGDEGDPGAFMDRLLLESCPFRVLEGMAAAVYVLRASEAILYIRSEYPQAVRRVRQAISLLEENGFIGEKATCPDLRIPFRVAEGAGAFVCGEETALLESLEGRRGHPRQKPPYPAVKGYRGNPTIINNVETFANIPKLLCDTRFFSSLGSPGNQGTKTFALAGKIRRSGLIEVPLGMTIRDIVETIGGGVSSPRVWKAVQIGGPSGGCLPASLADRPVDFDSLRDLNAMMGSGGLVVLDDRDCMVDMARYFMEFMADESCGQCPACRIGTKRMLQILEKICRGKGKENDLQELEELAADISERSLCGLGSSAPNPVLTTLKYFRGEYEAHVNGLCPAGVCKELFRIEAGQDCIGCTLCSQHCPLDAIPYQPYQRATIVNGICDRCGICLDVCPREALHVC